MLTVTVVVMCLLLGLVVFFRHIQSLRVKTAQLPDLPKSAESVKLDAELKLEEERGARARAVLAQVVDDASMTDKSGRLIAGHGKDYIYAAQPPKSVDAMLASLSESKKSKYRVPLDEKDLNRKVSAPSLEKKQVPLLPLKKNPPVSSENSQGSGITLIKVPVQAHRLDSVDSFNKFMREHKTSLPRPNFSAQMMIVLTVKDNMPSKIIELLATKARDGNIVITYRVDPFEARFGGKDKFPYTIVKKSGKPVVLEQSR